MYKLNYFNFKEKDKDNYLLTNDFGKYIFVNKDDFFKIVKRQELSKELYNKLIENKFIYEGEKEIFANIASKELRKQKSYVFMPTSLHIFVVTKNCNFSCIYCQAGNLSEKENFNMSFETAKKAVDIAVSSPSPVLTFEFQGGEPLINFETIKFIVEYSEEIKKDKIIEYNIVSNLTLINDEIIEFIKKHNICICTSIDGPRKLQNINRPYKEKDSYIETKKSIEKLKENEIYVSAIQTTSKFCFDFYKEIVDEYISLGLHNIFIRPLTRLGKADENWNRIGYTAEEFVSFYRKILEYIIEKNKSGYYLVEGHSSILLKKILKNTSVNYMELRSPCGGAIGQLTYYYNGDIYTCDEARMLSEMGDDSFKLGNVKEDNYLSLMNSDTTKAMCISSCLECSSVCRDCVYMPYCGNCPVINLAQNNNIFMKSKNEYRCKVYGGILDRIFEYINNNDEKVMEIFERWSEEN